MSDERRVDVVGIRNPTVVLLLSDGAELAIHVTPVRIVRTGQLNEAGQEVYHVTWRGVVDLVVPPRVEH